MTESNKNVAESFFAAINARDLDAVVALLGPSFVNHAASPTMPRGADGMRRIFEMLYRGMPDLRFTCLEVVAEGERVVCLVELRGTQTGPLEIPALRLPASGAELVTTHLHLFHVTGGRITAHWGGRDDIGMLRQLGHLPRIAA